MTRPETLPLTPALRHMIELATHTLGHPRIQLASHTDLDTSEMWRDDLLIVADYLEQSGDELQVAADRLRDIVAARRCDDALDGLPTQDGDTIDVTTAGGAS